MEQEKKTYKMTHEECGCKKEDFVASLKFLPKEVLLDMVKDEKIEAVCEKCGQEYKLQGEELKQVEAIANNKQTITGCDLSSCANCQGC